MTTTTPRYATTRLRHYKRFAYAMQVAAARAEFRQLEMAVIQTPLGFAVCRADQTGMYELSGGAVVAMVGGTAP